MLSSIYKVEKIGDGFLAIMARLRADEWTAEDFSGLGMLGGASMESLHEVSEARELNLSNEEKICFTAGLTFDSFSIPDRVIPESALALSKLV